MPDDIHFMKLALREARKGRGRTSPNPCVGAVVVKGDKVIAKGYHRRAGTPHAEVNALRAAGKNARGAIIYITLEPCNHKGRTPPCTHALLESGVARVVVGMTDPNPHVAGGGCTFLADHGISVTCGVLEDSCKKLNRPFIKHIRTGHPWVIMKAGCSLDGRIAVGSGKNGWITNDQSRLHVHRIRDRVDAILVGIGTATNDDPSLTTRLPAKKGKDPLRVVLDTHLRLPLQARMLTQSSNAATWIFCGPQASHDKRRGLEAAGAMVKSVPLAPQGGLDLQAVLSELGREQVTSVLVEGGSRVHGSFLRHGLVDQAMIYMAPFFIGADGVSLLDDLGLKTVEKARRMQPVRVKRFQDDVMIEGIFTDFEV